ncbi:MAG: SGNH/GDSL hydrolase family protein [Dehalococcoidia bacterium]|nr:MAG: SGNH/GDSL hydrolase family protein [Dehalococcoidia bacterium]
MSANLKTRYENMLKNYKLNRIAWLQRHGSVYFPFWDMVFKYPWLAIFNWLLRSWAGMTNSCIIHVVGDSHVKPFIFQWPFHVHHISQATAHNLVKEGSFAKSSMFLDLFLSKINRKRDVVLLVFGEIDARVHIYLQYGKSGKTLSFDTLIGSTVDRYGQAITKMKNDGFDVCIHGIPPAASKEFITALPFSGKPRERSEISRQFNTKLREYCNAIGVTYVDIQSIASDANGFIKKYYLADEVHCNRRIVPFTRKTIIEALKDKKKFT